MSEIEQYQGADVVVADEQLSPIGRWALDARQAYLVAESLSKTSFVPASMKGKPGEVTAAILAGAEIGLQPMSALRSIDVIQGTPAMRALAQRGLVQSRGHDVWVEESTITRAVVCGRRKGSEHVQKSTWTIDRAKRLGLTGKSNWQTQPDAMLVARATAEVCRLIASDVLLGMPYAVEELDDSQPATDAGSAAPARRTARRKPVPTPQPEPELEPEAPTIEDDDETAEPATGEADE